MPIMRGKTPVTDYENADNKLDLLPYPGEWYAYRIYAGKKAKAYNKSV